MTCPTFRVCICIAREKRRRSKLDSSSQQEWMLEQHANQSAVKRQKSKYTLSSVLRSVDCCVSALYPDLCCWAAQTRQCISPALGRSKQMMWFGRLNARYLDSAWLGAKRTQDCPGRARTLAEEETRRLLLTRHTSQCGASPVNNGCRYGFSWHEILTLSCGRLHSRTVTDAFPIIHVPANA